MFHYSKTVSYFVSCFRIDKNNFVILIEIAISLIILIVTVNIVIPFNVLPVAVNMMLIISSSLVRPAHRVPQAAWSSARAGSTSWWSG